MYIVKTFDKVEFKVSDEEALKIAEALNAGKQKAITLQGNIVLLSSISGILKEEKLREQDEEKEHKLGVLHDGTRVIRQFGEWFCMNGERDDRGLYAVRPDINYYPEVYMDCVPSIETFETRYRSLPLEERKVLMLDGKDISRFYRSEGGFSRIGEQPKVMIENKSTEPEWCEEHQAFKVDCPCYEKDFEDIGGEVYEV